MSRRNYYKNKIDETIINILLSEIYYKNLIDLSEEIDERRNFKRNKEDYY